LSQNVDSTVEGIEHETKKLIEEQHKRDHPELYQQQAQTPQPAEGTPVPVSDEVQAEQPTSTESAPSTTQQ